MAVLLIQANQPLQVWGSGKLRGIPYATMEEMGASGCGWPEPTRGVKKSPSRLCGGRVRRVAAKCRHGFHRVSTRCPTKICRPTRRASWRRWLDGESFEEQEDALPPRVSTGDCSRKSTQRDMLGTKCPPRAPPRRQA